MPISSRWNLRISTRQSAILGKAWTTGDGRETTIDSLSQLAPLSHPSPHGTSLIVVQHPNSTNAFSSSPEGTRTLGSFNCSTISTLSILKPDPNADISRSSENGGSVCGSVTGTVTEFGINMGTSWYSILPSHLTAVETWIIRVFVRVEGFHSFHP